LLVKAIPKPATPAILSRTDPLAAGYQLKIYRLGVARKSVDACGCGAISLWPSCPHLPGSDGLGEVASAQPSPVG
jgi:hypothetical protein